MRTWNDYKEYVKLTGPEAKADIETDTLTFIAKVCPYNQIKEIEVKVVIE